MCDTHSQKGDGNPAAPSQRAIRIGMQIDRICVDYHRTEKSYPKTKKEASSWQYFFWDYCEHLVIDRDFGTIELSQEVDEGCTVLHTYRMRETVVSLLDHFSSSNLFFARHPMNEQGVEQLDAEDADLIKDPDHKTSYLITIQYEKGLQRLLAGRYDKDGLPDDFSDFMNPIFSLVQHYGAGEMIFPSTYEKKPRRKSDLIYCSVSFENSYTTYYYLTEDDSITAGDLVVVPAGRDNRLTVAKVTKVEYFAAEDVPFPIEKTKKILRRCTDEELKQFAET